MPFFLYLMVGLLNCFVIVPWLQVIGGITVMSVS